MAKLTVFVACPYTLFPLDDYKNVFSTIKKSYNVEFKFADEQITNQHVLSKITNYIRDADISLYDITGWNPNVALELGIAVGMGKRYFILLNHKHDANKEVPSDIKGIDRIQYASNQELEAKIAWLIKQELPNEDDKSESAFNNIRLSIKRSLKSNPGLKIAEIADAIKEDKIIVQSTLRSMTSNGELKTKGQARGTTYYTGDTDLRTIKKKR